MDNEQMKQLVEMHSDQISPPFDVLLKLVGYDALCDLSNTYEGTSIYIPTKKRIFNKCVKKQVIKEFDGGNYKALAEKYGYCERSIRNILE